MKTKFYIFSPYFYMLISIVSAEAASLIFTPAPRLAYSVFSAVIPLVVYLKNGGGKICFGTKKITVKIVIAAVFVWAGGNLLNSAFNALPFINEIVPPRQLEPETDVYGTMMNIICACVAAPICEEITYRGIILKSAFTYGKETAIFISALLFALAHGSVTLLVMPFIYGIICGIIAVKTGSVVPGILIHAMCNLLSYVCTKADFPESALITAVLGAIFGIWFAVSAIKHRSDVKSAIVGFLDNPDFWMIPIFIKTILSNIIYHGG